MSEQLTGAEIVLKSLLDQGVEVVFGYPGGAVLPIYDSLFENDEFNNISPILIDELNQNDTMSYKTCMICYDNYYTKDGKNDVQHNAYPIRGDKDDKSGYSAKCCTKCNLNRVIPKRLQLSTKQSSTKTNKFEFIYSPTHTNSKKKKLRIKVKRK